MRHDFSHHGVEEKTDRFQSAFPILPLQKMVLHHVLEVQGKNDYDPPRGVAIELFGPEVPSAEFLLKDAVGLLHPAVPFSLPYDYFLSIHALSLSMVEDRSFLDFGVDAGGFECSPYKVKDVELFDSGDLLFKKPHGFCEVERVSGKR